MSQTGFLLLTLPIRCAFDHLGNHLLTASKHVRKKLYVKFHCPKDIARPQSRKSYLQAVTNILPSLYANVSSYCRNLDVRLILDPAKMPYNNQVEVIITDNTDIVDSNVQDFVNKSCINVVRLQKLEMSEINDENNVTFNTYGNVVLGGTFDRLHNGHKVFLSIAALRAKKKLVIGITDGIMLKHKFLWEMIEPIEKRIENVIEFLTDVNPCIEYAAVPIYDVYGPAIEPYIDCIVVSEETKRGGDKVNEQREKLNLNSIPMITVNLVEDELRNIADEFKLSSSNKRRSLLATYLKVPQISSSSVNPLCIALIGGLHCCACGFESELRKANITMFDIEGFILGLEVFADVLLTIGLTKDSCSRELLHRTLLSDGEKLKLIRSSLSLIESSIQQEIAKAKELGASAIILKMPFYFGPELLKMVHQVWGTIVPESNRVEYLKKYLNVTDDEAAMYLANDISNTEVLSLSHMVFCPTGEPSFISMQVQRALKELNLPESNGSL